MHPDPLKPLIVNSDFTVLLETRSEDFRNARDSISGFLDLEKSPEMFHTYRMTEVSLWNGFSLGMDAETIIAELAKWSKFDIPELVVDFIKEQHVNFGQIELHPYDENNLIVKSKKKQLLNILAKSKELEDYLIQDKGSKKYLVPIAMRGVVKLEFIRLGFPVVDLAGFIEGDPVDIELRSDRFSARDYQRESIDACFGSGKTNIFGAGIIVLPCGAGKTIVGILAMARLKMKTLIISPNIISVRQWKAEIIEKTNIPESMIGEYSGETKVVRPITIATYQILVYRQSKKGDFKHLSLFTQENWGLVIYDEVHLLPAPVFRTIAGIQAKRRLGLTATLIREDGRERDVFALIGPKKYDMPWKDLESQEYIANAVCYEIRVQMDKQILENYHKENEKSQFRLAAENRGKLEIIGELLARFKNNQIIIIGQYIDQLKLIAEHFNIPLITGKTANDDRQHLYKQFRENKLSKLVVSRVANFAIDLPDADVAIQVSGIYGSRQEEAQRLGRIIRPKANENRAWFFTLVTENTSEEMYAQNRKRFLIEQGYEYHIIYQRDLLENNTVL